MALRGLPPCPGPGTAGSWHNGMGAEKSGSGTQDGYSHLAVSWLARILGRQMFAAGKEMILKDVQEYRVGRIYVTNTPV